MKTYYYIYKITCLVGSFKDHYYIGQRKCHCLPEEDPYKGSGRVIKNYYKKYPNDYEKEILCYCKDENELNEKEAFYIGDLYNTDPMCLNLKAGGNHAIYSEESCKKISESVSGENHPMYGKPAWNKDKQLSEEHKNKMSENHADVSGENNPAFGRKWMNNGLQQKYVKPDEINIYLEKGYSFGRLKNKIIRKR